MPRAPSLQVREARPADGEAMWRILQAILATGDTLPFCDGFDHGTFLAHWFGSHPALVATQGADVVGMYKLGPNYPGRGSHIASATYLVAPEHQGKGIGRALVEHSLERAGATGYLGVQFNYVVSTNAAAVGLYRRLGFDIVGTVPKAFRHRHFGLVDVHVMFRSLAGVLGI